MEVLLHLLTSTNHEWTQSDGLQPILLRLCARYLLFLFLSSPFIFLIDSEQVDLTRMENYFIKIIISISFLANFNK